jgi:hypothetical protein
MQVQKELEEFKHTHHMPYEELNRVVKERDRLAEERDNLYSELKRLRSEVAELRPLSEHYETDKAELLQRYETEKKEIRNYMMIQDQKLTQALNAYDHQKAYIDDLQQYIDRIRLPEERLLQLKRRVVVTEQELHLKADTFNWDLLFQDLEHVYHDRVQHGGDAMEPPPTLGPIPAVHWDRDEFLARLQRHFANAVGSSPAKSPKEATKSMYGSNMSQPPSNDVRNFDPRPPPSNNIYPSEVSIPCFCFLWNGRFVLGLAYLVL